MRYCDPRHLCPAAAAHRRAYCVGFADVLLEPHLDRVHQRHPRVALLERLRLVRPVVSVHQPLDAVRQLGRAHHLGREPQLQPHADPRRRLDALTELVAAVTAAA
eukprot:1249803-Prymnesium_polylepis.1